MITENSYSHVQTIDLFFLNHFNKKEKNKILYALKSIDYKSRPVSFDFEKWFEALRIY